MSIYEQLTLEEKKLVIEYIASNMEGFCDFPNDVIDAMKETATWKEFFKRIDDYDILKPDDIFYRMIKLILK